jgi:hypothetical protein
MSAFDPLRTLTEEINDVILTFDAPLSALVLSLRAASPRTDARRDWEQWFAEYDVIPAGQASRQPVLLFFKHRFVFWTKGESIAAAQRSDVALGYRVFRANGAYFVDTLPVFAPGKGTTSVVGGGYDCSAVEQEGGYAVTCRSVYIGATYKSFYRPDLGVTWFEFACENLEDTCRYQLASGAKGLLRREFLRALDRSGGIRTDAPVRPKPSEK